METFLSIVHVSTIVLLVLVVLLQSGKGAEISASFGGSSQTVFGSSGGANFFTKFTAALATLFMCTSIALTVIGTESRRGVFEGTAATQPIDPLAPKGGEAAPTASDEGKTKPKTSPEK